MIYETFFQRLFFDIFGSIGENLGPIDLFDILHCLFWSIILSMVIAITYKNTHNGIAYSKNFTQTLVLLGIIGCSAMLFIGTDLARAFTMLGALSIIRFRNAVKDTKDAGFIFLSIVCGIGVGSRYFLIAIISSIIACLVVYLLDYTNFGELEFNQDILEFNIPNAIDYENNIEKIMEKHVRDFSLIEIQPIDSENSRFSILIIYKDENKKSKNRNKSSTKRARNSADLGTTNGRQRLLEALKKIDYITEIKIINGNDMVSI